MSMRMGIWTETEAQSAAPLHVLFNPRSLLILLLFTNFSLDSLTVFCFTIFPQRFVCFQILEPVNVNLFGEKKLAGIIKGL